MPSDDTPTRRADEGDYLTRKGLAAGQTVFGRYVLEAVLGQGGMGVVWRARDEELGNLVALKFLPEIVARDDPAIDELREETRNALRLTHPNIVRIHHFEHDGSMAAVSMEYVDGTTLSKLRLAQPGKVFSAEKLGPLVAQLCAALDYAHQQAKVVHRDLKPANIMVTAEGMVKVTDFGIARSLSETSTRLTGKGGASSGTLPYMSPQQVLGRKPAASDDIYALGATLYELLTGKPPFFRGEAYSLMKQIADVAPLTLAKQRAELEVTGEAIPPAWEETILACLAKEPQDRPQSAGEVTVRLGLGGTTFRAHTTGDISLHTKAIMDPDDHPTVRPPVTPELKISQQRSKTPWLSALAAVEQGQQPVAGWLHVTSEPSGANVTMDARPLGRTPLRTQLPPGTHELVVDGGPGLVTHRTIGIEPGKELHCDMTLQSGAQGSLLVTTDPVGADVTVLDSSQHRIAQGKSPLRVPLLAPGSFTIQAQMSGHARVSRHWTVVANRENHIWLKLEPQRWTHLGRKPSGLTKPPFDSTPRQPPEQTSGS